MEMGSKLELKISDRSFYMDFEDRLAYKKFIEYKEQEFYRNARQIINKRRPS